MKLTKDFKYMRDQNQGIDVLRAGEDVNKDHKFFSFMKENGHFDKDATEERDGYVEKAVKETEERDAAAENAKKAHDDLMEMDDKDAKVEKKAVKKTTKKTSGKVAGKMELDG